MAAITVLIAVMSPLATQNLLFLKDRPIEQHSTDIVNASTIATIANGAIKSETLVSIAKTSPYIERAAAMTLKNVTTTGTNFFITIL